MRRLFPWLAAASVAACSGMRWSGGGPPPQAGPVPTQVSQEAHPRAPDPYVPPSTERQKQTAVFYSDLGPEEVDVSQYPLQQRRNYRVFASACARCHGLSRTLYAPAVGRVWWEFYVMSMRARGRISGDPFTREEVAAVLDFLDYDVKERKVRRAKEFERVSAELKRRYEALMEERLERLQKGPQPKLLNAP